LTLPLEVIFTILSQAKAIVRDTFIIQLRGG